MSKVRFVSRPKAKAYDLWVMATGDFDWFMWMGCVQSRDKRTGEVVKSRRYRFREPRCTSAWLAWEAEDSAYRWQLAADFRACEAWSRYP